MVVEDEGKAGLAAPDDRSGRPRGASRPAARRRALRSSSPGRRPPQLEGRPHAARPLGGQGARGRRGTEACLMRVLVTGGSGLLGRRTIAALAARGHDVVALQRHRTDTLACEQVLADVRDADAVAAAAAGCDAVIHGAAKVGVVGTREEFRDGQRRWHRGRRRGLPGCPTCRDSSSSPRRQSATSRRPTVGAGAAAPITQRSDRSWYSESKAEAELVALAANGGALSVTAIRPHAIWGPGDTQLVGRIVERARAGRLFVVGGGQRADRHDLRGQRRRRARRCSRATHAQTARSPAARSSSRTASRSPLRSLLRADLRGRGRAASGARPPARPRARHGRGRRAPVGARPPR